MMPVRNTHRIGDYLAVDEESGLVHYASEMKRDWDGQLRHKDNLDGRHPQLDVRPKMDPRPLRDVRPKNWPSVCLYTEAFIRGTTVPTPKNSGQNFAGIGTMTIEGSCGPFVVWQG